MDASILMSLVMSAAQATLREGVPFVLALLVIRLIPIVVHAAVLGGARVQSLVCSLTVWLGAFGTACSVGVLPGAWVGVACGAYTYFLGATAVVELGRRLLARGTVSRVGVFTLFVVLLVLVPAYLFRGAMQTFVIAVGWERALASFSYCVDNRRVAPSWRAAVFFLWANPALVWSQQGSRLPAPQLTSGLFRIVIGLAVLLLGEFIKRCLRIPLFRPTDLLAIGSIGEGVRFFATQFAAAVELTCAHAGLASLQIGALLLFGFRVPERYVRPLLSTSPADFWRRWNIWIGDWARKYLFRPMVRALRSHLSKRRMLVSVIAVMYTFLVLGALHDLAIVALRLANGAALGLPVGTTLFAGLALIYITWEAASGAMSRGFKLILPVARGPTASIVLDFLRWVVLITLIAVTLWFALPALGGRLPDSLARILSVAQYSDSTELMGIVTVT